MPFMRLITLEKCVIHSRVFTPDDSCERPGGALVRINRDHIC